MRVPNLAILTRSGDSRLPLVHTAIAFWDGVFAELGSGFRLGPGAEADGAVAAADLAALSDATLRGDRAAPPPDSVSSAAGDIVVALSDGNFVSFAHRWVELAKALVAIKGDRYSPLTLPNVARNVIAHELGHAIGLGHNSDPAMLMCGRPASCRPDAFASSSARYFPLTDDEKATLLWLYPTGWRAR
jgi:hypothetical protein